MLNLENLKFTCEKVKKAWGAAWNNSSNVVPRFEPACNSVSLSHRDTIEHVSGVTV